SLVLVRVEIFQSDPASCAQALACLFDTAQKSWVIFKTVFEPVLFRLEADQHARRLAVTRNDDLLRLGLPEKARQVVLDFGQRDFLHSGSANCASHASASDLGTIAKTSTVVPETS